MKLAGQQFKGLEGTIRNLKIGLLAFGATAAIATKSFIKVASDAVEIQSKFDVVFSSIEKDMNDWAESFSNSAGRARQDIKNFTAGIADVLKPMGLATGAAAEMSKEMVALALDVASFNNRQDADVVRAFTSALTGERESLKTLGIVINETDVQQEAYRSGITKVGEALTKEAKATATMNLLFKNSKDAQGDLIRTQDTFANRLKTTQSAIKNLQEEIGIKLLPMAAKLLGKFNELIDKARVWAEWIDKNKDTIIAFVQVISGAGGLLFVITKVNTAIKLMTASLKALALMSGTATTATTGLKLALLGLPAAIAISVALVGLTLVVRQIREIKASLDEMVDAEDRLHKTQVENIKKFVELKRSEDADIRAVGQAQIDHMVKVNRVRNEGAKIDLWQSQQKIDAARAVVQEKGKLIEVEKILNGELSATGEILKQAGVDAEGAGNNIGGGMSAALEATKAANEAFKKFGDTIKDFKENSADAILDVTNKITDLNDKIAEMVSGHEKNKFQTRKEFADAFVTQEQRVADIQQELARETDSTRRAELESSLAREEAALQKFSSLEQSHQSEIQEIRRRASLTQFERTIEDIRNRSFALAMEFNEKKKKIEQEILLETNKLQTIRELNEIAIKEQDKFLARSEKMTAESINAQIEKYNELASAISRAQSGRTTSFSTLSESVLDRASQAISSLNVTVNGDVSGQELITKVSEGIMSELRTNLRVPL